MCAFGSSSPGAPGEPHVASLGKHLNTLRYGPERTDLRTESSETATLTVINASPTGEPPTTTDEGPSRPPADFPGKPRKWTRWAVPAGALVLGVGIGGAAGISDPTGSEEYRALQEQLSASEEQIATLEDEVDEVMSRSRQAQIRFEERRTELDEREAALAAREEAVTTTEQQVAANSISQGIWTVGVDIEPGTYRTSAPVTSECYWGIYTSGSNGSDIIDNDIVEGGFPTVQLGPGQDFENNGCGTFVKQ